MSQTFGDPGSPETDYRYPFLHDVGYIGGGGSPGDDCGCQYACFPYFQARTEAVYNTREKVGFEEFGTPSDPPRFFLLKHTTWRCYTAGESPTPTFWEKVDIDPETGGGTTTESDPAFTSCPATSATPEVELETPTLRRTVWTVTSGDDVAYRLVQLEVLSKEFTTEQLKNMTIDELPAWAPDDEDWPGENEPGFPGTAYFVQSGICYQSGDFLWSPVGRLQVPSVWRLAADETEFFIQRVRYRIVFPHMVGAVTFRAQWRERFWPDGGDLEAAGSPITFDGDQTTPETGIIEINEREENGEVFLCCAQFVAP